MAWNTLAETVLPQALSQAAAPAAEASRLSVFGQEADTRYRSGFDEFDRVLGGGLVPGSVVLIGGDPGVGKSTLLQQVSARMSRDRNVCYASGEESVRQVVERFEDPGNEVPHPYGVRRVTRRDLVTQPSVRRAHGGMQRPTVHPARLADDSRREGEA